MVRLSDLSEIESENLRRLPCPHFDSTPFARAPNLRDARVAIVTSAGISMKGDETFSAGSCDFRVIPSDAGPDELVMSHVSVNYDRSGFIQDLNTVFPLNRLRELENARKIGSSASFHFSFMGATEPQALETSARSLSSMLKEDKVNAVFLTPV